MESEGPPVIATGPPQSGSVTKRQGTLPTAPPTIPVRNTRQWVLLIFAIEGDLRFISHRDTVRMLERTAVRAGLPLAYSQGFNPHARISLPLPRAVGMAATADLAVVQLSGSRSCAAIGSALQAQLPRGARVVDVRPLPGGGKPRLTAVTYACALPCEHHDHCAAAVARLLAGTSFSIERTDEKGRPKDPLDVRPFVERLQVEHDHLSFTLGFRDGRTLAPKDLFSALELPWEQLRHTVRRQKVEWH